VDLLIWLVCVFIFYIHLQGVNHFDYLDLSFEKDHTELNASVWDASTAFNLLHHLINEHTGLDMHSIFLNLLYELSMLHFHSGFCLSLLPSHFCLLLLPLTFASHFCLLLLPLTFASCFCLSLLPLTFTSHFFLSLLPLTCTYAHLFFSLIFLPNPHPL
jgi:hypothetical protein